MSFCDTLSEGRTRVNGHDLLTLNPMEPDTMAKQDLITLAQMREILDYNSKTGAFLWKARADRSKSWNSAFAGTAAGWVDKKGYIIITIGVDYRAHRIAWLLAKGKWPPPELDIDHRNRDKGDNRIENLRIATRTQNNANANLRSNNRSGAKGVSWDKVREKWTVRTRVGGKYCYLGRFDEFDDAVEAYRRAVIKAHGEFAKAQ